MKYFKNTELAKIYNVSEKSVRNWIAAAQEGKLELQLFEQNGRQWVANSPRNTVIIDKLVAKGMKYKNSRAFKIVTPSADFYELCSQRQIFDLISNIDIHREIPHQYSYLDGGAAHWDQYAWKLLHEQAPNSVTNTIQLLDLSKDYIDALAEGHKGFNVIDIGPGNCLPIKDFLAHLIDKGLLVRYIALDVSPDMIAIAERNINEWFGDKIKFEGYIRDINYDRFEDVTIADSFGQGNGSIINLILFFGGTISNLRDPAQALHILNSSMGKNDYFMVTRKLDTEATRRYFDFTVDTTDGKTYIKEKRMLDLLGIDESYYEIEHYFDQQKMARMMHARLKLDILLKFQLEGKERNIMLRKGEGITLWRSDHKTLRNTVDQLSDNGFEVITAMKSKDLQYSLIISKLRIVE